MTEETARRRYVTRMVPRSEVPRMAVIQHDAFNDPSNTTPDEISTILTAEEAASASQPPTRAERIAKTEQRHHDMFAKNKYTIIGAYALPPNSPATIPDGLADTADPSDLPHDAQLAGFAVWQKITPTSNPDSTETDKLEHQDPTLLNKFFAKMNRTRESTMQGKSYWFLKLLTIHPQHQRRGVGSILVNWGTQRADHQHIHAWLESSPMGKGAYLKAGFKVLGNDQIPEPRAKRGYVEWPYMLYEPKPSQ